ncbi:MAG: aminodeoxychorismate/anthranilate synthase component II [Desulfobulbaceae bacterium]|nr:aminodeoxychorismate/anthranilate synthase component II [Desulfobulbaceae bacterium]
MLVLIDNYDSFTYNIVQMLGTAPPNAAPDWQRPEMRVIRNDAITVADLLALKPERLLVSPGPCTLREAGISVEAILACSRHIPVLGVCLGHQSMGVAFGGVVVRAARPMHGKTSPVTHDGRGVFAGLPSPFTAMRYHSLVVEEASLPSQLTISARSDDHDIMGLRHASLPVEGIQFHPESIMTTDGLQLLHTFLRPDYCNLL